MKFLSSLVLTATLAASSVFATLQIVPGAIWTAAGTNQHVQAHGGGIKWVAGTYYWIGENKINSTGLSSGNFQSVNCYSSQDLVQWTFVNKLLTQQPSGDLKAGSIIERPKVIWNAKTQTWVMWMHVDTSGYGYAAAGVATSKTICGNYTYLGSSRPLGFQSRDMGLFKDTDGAAYLLSEDRPNGLRINRLSDDYLSVTGTTYLFPNHIEAPTMVKKNGLYYLFGSHLTGWNANDNVYTTAPRLTGPWTPWTTFAPVGTNTYQSQITYVMPVGNTMMFMGDRWWSDALMASTYIWLPMTFSGTKVTMGYQPNWTINPGTGAWAPGPMETAPEAESPGNTLTNDAAVHACPSCSGGDDVTSIGGALNGGLQFNGVKSNVQTKTTIRVRYETPDNTTQYFASVDVNSKVQTLNFMPTKMQIGKMPGSVMHVALDAGMVNTIKFSGVGGKQGPNIDRLMVPMS